MLEPEADELERELVRAGRRWPSCGEQPLAQLAQRQVGRVEDDVRLGPDRLEPAALLGDRAGDAALVAERVAVARLAEAADQDLVARLEEDDPRPDAATLERAAHRRQGERRVAGPDVEDDRDPREPLAVGRDELGEVGQQLAGQVVDDRVAEVLEELGGGRLAAAGQAADDDDGRLGRPRPDVAPRLRPRRSPPAAPDEEDGQLEQEVHRAAEDERADEVAARRRDRGEDRDAEDDHPARRRSGAPT